MRLGGRWVEVDQRVSARPFGLCIVSQFTNSSKVSLCVYKIHATDYLNVLRTCKHTSKWCLDQLLLSASCCECGLSTYISAAVRLEIRALQAKAAH